MRIPNLLSGKSANGELFSALVKSKKLADNNFVPFWNLANHELNLQIAIIYQGSLLELGNAGIVETHRQVISIFTQ
jgi:hypothetical protein